MSADERKSDGELYTGYNWRNVLTDFATISGILAGFSITFIVLVLGARAPYSYNSTELEAACGQLTVFSLGISAALFISAAQFFLLAKEFDIYGIPARYIDVLKREYGQTAEDWERFEKDSNDKCHWYNSRGTSLYNAAVFMIWIGVLFATFPYNLWVAFVVAGLGIILEAWQTHSK